MPEIQGRRPSGISSFVTRKRDPIEILVDGQDGSYVNTYTTLDRITGRVLIKFDRNTEFDKLLVLFEGVSNTFIEKVSTPSPTSGRSVASHTFLRLAQPIDLSTLPPQGIAIAGETYPVDFTFIVPEKLLDNICKHRTSTRRGIHDPTKDEHLLLPPSLGDCMVAGEGQTLMDDIAPDMTKISYMIKVVLAKRRSSPSQKDIEVASKSLKLRIIPAREEKPPLTIADDSPDYQMRKEKDVKKGTFKIGKTGRVVAEAVQPKALMLPPPNIKAEAPVATSTTINLRFDPCSEEMQPPTLGSLSTKLKVLTFFGTVPFKETPSRTAISSIDTNRGVYLEAIDLSTRPVSSVQWIRHEPSDAANGISPESRRGSASSLYGSAVPEPSATFDPSLPYYSASLLLPVALPHSTSTNNRKTFTPTFDSCLVSRQYVLDLHLSYHCPSTTVSLPSLQLKVPVQIASRGNPDARPSISADEMASIQARMQMMAETEEFWRPRRMTLVEDGQEVDPSMMRPTPDYQEQQDWSSPTQPRHVNESYYASLRRASELATIRFGGPVEPPSDQDLPHYTDVANPAQARRALRSSWLEINSDGSVSTRHNEDSYGPQPGQIYRTAWLQLPHQVMLMGHAQSLTQD